MSVMAIVIAAVASLGLAGPVATAGGPPPSSGAADVDIISAPGDPPLLVADLARSLFSELDKNRAGFRRDPNQLVPVLDRLLSPHFDMDYTARLVLGTHWRTTTAAYRERFALAIFRTLLRTYAGAVAEWTADRFRLLPFSGDEAALQATVRTQVVRTDGSLVTVDYRLHRTAEAWKVFDVLVDGISYVRTYHDDVDSDVNQRGLDFAIARLERTSSSASAR
jgi:phospholipid transport system substrate-binding protein